jgi:S1-C subfamily serine protease
MSLLPVVLVCCFAPAPPPKSDANIGYLGVDFVPGPNELTLDSLYVGSPALQAGLSSQDVIVALDGVKVRTVAELVRQLRRKKPDTVVVVTVLREGEELPFKVKLGKQFPAYLGVMFGGTMQVFDFSKESPARQAGVQLRDQVLSIDGRNLTTPAELIAYLKDKKAGDVVTLMVRRATGDVKVEVKLGKRPGL